MAVVGGGTKTPYILFPFANGTKRRSTIEGENSGEATRRRVPVVKSAPLRADANSFKTAL